jgi:hypothetical protein
MRWRHAEDNSGKSEGPPAVLKFPTALRTRSFGIVFARSHHPIFSLATLIESTSSYSAKISLSLSLSRAHLLGPVTFTCVPTFPSYVSFRSSDYNCLRISQSLIFPFLPTSPLVTQERSPTHSFPRHCQSMSLFRGTKPNFAIKVSATYHEENNCIRILIN